jgi:thioredoxin 1
MVVTFATHCQEEGVNVVPTEVTAETFQTEVLESAQPVIVDFWAIWCRPCRAVGPELESLVEDYPEVRLVKVNVDEEPELTQRYGVMNIPAMILFADGEPKAAVSGAMPKQLIARRLGLTE